MEELAIHARLIAKPVKRFKECNTCGEVKPLKSFYRYWRNKDGRLGRCKRCFGEAQKRREMEDT